MNTLKDLALEYIDSENKYGKDKDLYHYNCAEVLLYSCNDYYKLDLDSKMLKAIVPFGGGMYSEITCGILTGSIAALGLIFTEEKPSTNNKVKDITREWLSIFENRFGNIDCRQLKKDYKDPESGCKDLMLDSAEALESLINKYK